MISENRKGIRLWYWSGASLVFFILIVGGITRLTESGLSMVDWKPIMGIIPPLNEAQWIDTFEQYKQFPEYHQRNAGMGLSEFQVIFFWEYLHRMLGRVLGIVFIIPFGYFLLKHHLDRIQLKRSLFLLTLGVIQGLMGWFMVKSGLMDVPYVSHYRLAAHLFLAFIIFGACVYFAIDLETYPGNREKAAARIRRWLLLFIVVLILQIIWGAFVAGLKAGYVYNTFPKMLGSWIPPGLYSVSDIYNHQAGTQYIHRVLGTLLGLTAIVMWVQTVNTAEMNRTKKWATALLLAVFVQYALGVLTLLFHVPIVLGAVHQAAALILTGMTIGFYHYLQRASGPQSKLQTNY